MHSPLLLALLALPCSAPPQDPAPTRLLRFPDVHGERVAFCYAGDLWTAPSSGGTATRLTAHPGLELFPRFSPDGRWIAFTGQYDGDEQVYVVPATGGIPKQLTWYPARGPLTPRWGWDNQVYGWTADGASILFRSMREGWDLTDTRLFTVPREGGPAAALPMPVSGAGDISPDGKQVVYSPLTRDFRTWKRYEGGWAQDLYVYDLANAALTPVAHSKRTERDPMWIGDSIYFASDRDGTLNLYVWDTSGEVQQLTHETQSDVRWPSKGEADQIVYELDGVLHVFDTRGRQDRKLDIFVPNDGVAMRAARTQVADQVEGLDLSPKGERVLVAAHGDVFSVPPKKGEVRNLTRTSGAHEREAAWSPDGARVAFFSDRTGEEELYVTAQDGSGVAEPLTSGGKVRRYRPLWSPPGTHIAFNDKDGRLWVVQVETRELLEVGKDRGGSVGDYAWSADGAHLAFSLAEESGFRALWIYTLAERALRRVTDGVFNASEPYFDPKGRWLFFLSDREYAPQLSTAEWNFATARSTGIFALALRADVPHPFPPESDEVELDQGASESDVQSESPKEDEKGQDEVDEEKKDADKEDEKDAKAPPAPVRIDFDGLARRVARVPVEADNYVGLTANEKALFYLRRGDSYYGRSPDRTAALMVFDLEKREAEVLVDTVNGYQLSGDGSKLLVQGEGRPALYDAAPKSGASRKEVSLAGLFVERVPAEEWPQIFDEVWRRFRDYFYAPNMHGYDWSALREQYRPLVAHVAHRSDLNYVIGEMIAELNVSHAYIAGGEWQAPERPKVALLGCQFELDRASGRYRIARILPGHNEEERYRSPLTEIGVDARVGEYLLAVDGRSLAAPVDPYQLLREENGPTVVLTLAPGPDEDGARKVEVRPLESETELLYLDHVLRRRELVAQLSGGRLGYIHIPDMGADGLREFIKWYYGQVRKEGLVVDVRNNGGGNVSQMLLERLRRNLLGTAFARTSEFTQTYPSTVFNGPMVCLLNENSASDGDIFPWMFREAGLGPLIGKRSWGGVVGISSHGPLIDGGQVSVPEFGYADAQGQWSVEGIGVMPDIEVENDPAAILAGRDPQLERGVKELLDRLATRSAALPARPPDPVKIR
jgi:tricorn protease